METQEKQSSVTKLWSSVTLWRARPRNSGMLLSVILYSYLPYFLTRKRRRSQKICVLWKYNDEGLILTLLQGIHARCTKTRYHLRWKKPFIFFIVCKILEPKSSARWVGNRRGEQRNCKKWEITSAIMWKGGCEGSVLLDVMMMMAAAVSKSQLFFSLWTMKSGRTFLL